MSCTTAKKSEQRLKCFGNKNGICTILSGRFRVDDAFCKYCAFYKTTKQYAHDRLLCIDKEIKFTSMSSIEAKHLRTHLENQEKGITDIIKKT